MSIISGCWDVFHSTLLLHCINMWPLYSLIEMLSSMHLVSFCTAQALMPTQGIHLSFLDARNYLSLHVLHHRRNSGIESVLQRHQEIQEQLAEDMISIAKTLRTRSEAARSIIRNDQQVQQVPSHCTGNTTVSIAHWYDVGWLWQVLKDASKVADQNIEGINRATGELKEKSRGCDWFTWITLTVVFIVFLQMILFIRLVSKWSLTVTIYFSRKTTCYTLSLCFP